MTLNNHHKCKRRVHSLRDLSHRGLLLLAGSLLIGGLCYSHPAGAASYEQRNLVSDGSVPADFTDPNLVNPWGIASSPTGPFWIADNGTGVSTVYNSNGQPFPANNPLEVTIPPPKGQNGAAAPTGIASNTSSDFTVSSGGKSGASNFIFATEDGTISGWNATVNPTNAVLAADNSGAGAVYKGLAIGNNNSDNFLFATDFAGGKIDKFNKNFGFVNSFTDPDPAVAAAGLAPFGIKNIGGNLFVTFAKQDAEKRDDVAGPGNGLVDVFDANGNLLRRIASGTALGGQAAALNSPWGIALAPDKFGEFSKDLLVGNFGNGHINAFDPATGNFVGELRDINGNPIVNDGLWGLIFGNGGNGGDPNTLFFTAGINGEQNGLFGSIEPVSAQPVPEPATVVLLLAGLGGLVPIYLWRKNKA